MSSEHTIIGYVATLRRGTATEDGYKEGQREFEFVSVSLYAHSRWFTSQCCKSLRTIPNGKADTSFEVGKN